MTFDEFQALNELRCKTAFLSCAPWGITEWALAIAGESGELCNLVKKVIRGDFSFADKRLELAKEAADIITYADLFHTHIGIATGQSVMDKFNEVSKRVNWKGGNHGPI